MTTAGDTRSSGRGNAIRIAANFTRLFAGFAIGLVVLRLLLSFGSQVYGTIAVLVAVTGLATSLRTILRAGSVPQLGHAWHAGDRSHFVSVYNSLLLSAAVCALVTVGVFGVVIACIPLLDIPAELVPAAKTFIWLACAQAVLMIAVDPVISMFMVTERMIEYNAIMLGERVVQLLAALAALHWIGKDGEPADLLIGYQAMITLGTAVLMAVFVALLVVPNPEFRLRRSAATRQHFLGLWATLGWNAVYIGAMSLHDRFNVVISNALFGLRAGMLFAIAMLLCSYVGQLTSGLVVGLDAVSARQHRKAGDEGLRGLVSRQMFMQSLLIFPAVTGILLGSEELLKLWIGNRIEDPAGAIPEISLLCNFLVLGIGARSLSDGWMKILNGAGKVRSYAPRVLIGGLLNPVVIFCGMHWLPERLAHLAPAYSFCGIFLVIQLVAVPLVVARFLKVGFWWLYRPCLMPAAMLVLALLVYLCLPEPAAWRLPVSFRLSGFSAAYGVLLVVCLIWKFKWHRPAEIRG